MRNRKLLSLLLITLCATSLQGCFTLAVGGVAATALAANDRRTTGIYVEDEGLEWKTQARVREKYPDAHLNATSFNLTVLLTGEIQSEEIKSGITQIVKEIPNVRAVTNEMVVRGNSSLTSRSSDTLITSSIKTRFVTDGRVSANHIKVVSEAGTVFLMGMVTRSEADIAAEIASLTSGVSRVVKVFEYIADGTPSGAAR